MSRIDIFLIIVMVTFIQIVPGFITNDYFDKEFGYQEDIEITKLNIIFHILFWEAAFVIMCYKQTWYLISRKVNSIDYIANLRDKYLEY